MARQEGLEPPAYCLEGSCSIRLSYWRISIPATPRLKEVERVMGIEPTTYCLEGSYSIWLNYWGRMVG